MRQRILDFLRNGEMKIGLYIRINAAVSIFWAAYTAFLLFSFTDRPELQSARVVPAAVVLNVLILFCLQNIFIFLTNRALLAFTLSFALLTALLAGQLIKINYWGRAAIPSDLLFLKEAWRVAFTFRPRRMDWGLFLPPAAILASLCSLFYLSAWSRLRLGGFFKRLRLAVPSFLFILAIVFWQALHLRKALASCGIENTAWDQVENLGHNGLVLSWMMNVQQALVAPPHGYSKAAVSRILSSQRGPLKPSKASEKPDLILYMVESFVDPRELGIQTSSDPIPFFRSLKRRFPSGTLRTPVFGGNTSAAEFEVLTGLREENLPFDAIPYEQFVRFPIPSLAGVLRREGYRTTAIHPFYSWYFNRETVYPLLGFERFLSLSDFSNPKMAGPYVSDGELVQKIIQQSKKGGSFFIYGITMATHGGYDWNYSPGDALSVLNAPDPESQRILDTYVRLLAHSDRELRRLIHHFENRKKKTLIVIFGDHAPPLGDRIYRRLDYFSRLRRAGQRELCSLVPIVFWANFDLPKDNIFTPAYALAPRVLDWMGLQTPPFFQLVRSLEREHAEIKFAPEGFSYLAGGVGTANIGTGVGVDPRNGLHSLLEQHRIIQHDVLFGERFSLRRESLVAHAGGGILGRPYTNSLEALNHSYTLGFKLMELDFEFTRDQELVLLHDWEETLEREFKVKRGKRSLQEFQSLHMVSGLTQLSVRDLFRWLEDHPSVRIVTDVKSDNLKTLSWIKNRYPDYARRFIPQIYSFEEYLPVRRMGYQDIIFTLYRSSAEDDDIVRFCRKHALFAVTMRDDRATQTKLAQRLISMGIYVYAHTVNDIALYRRFMTMGFTGVYTDFL